MKEEEMEVAQILELLHKVPEGASMIVTVLVILFTVYLKRSDVEVSQVTDISKLQTDQLSTLIKQNIDLSNSLHAVRDELTKAYGLIEEMRDRINVLENTLHRAEIKAEVKAEFLTKGKV